MTEAAHITLLKNLWQRLDKVRSQEVLEDELLEQLTQLIAALEAHQEDGWEDTRQWLNNLMMFTPQLAPAVDRSLLWTFGGDCLHFLTDDEIDNFQKLDELH